ncbi:Transcription elongation factor 1-like protein [Bienertia sinuspersici]
MGKRKSRAKPPPKKSIKLILFLAAPSAIMVLVWNVASLTEAIDIYSEWIDECERVNTVEDDGE